MSHYCSDRCYKLHEVARGAFSGDVSFWEENPGLSVTDFDISFRKKTKDGITYAEQQKAESVEKYARVEIPPEILKIKEERRRNEQRK